MFLSQLTLNPRSREVQAEVRDPYQMHRTLSHAFTRYLPQDERAAALEAARLLFRIEEGPEHKGALHVLAQSKTEPRWDYLAAPYLDARHPPRCKSFEPTISVGQRLRFRLLANPTRRLAPTITREERLEARAQGRKVARCGQRVGLYREWERLAWLQGKFAPCGFSVEEKAVSVRLERSEGKSHPDEVLDARDGRYKWRTMDLPTASVLDFNDGQRFPLPTRGGAFSAALFEGVLTVMDEAAFLSTLECGIGTGRGFGFGLLSVARTS